MKQPPLSQSCSELVAGVDLGTQGVRVLIADASGTVVAGAARSFPIPPEHPDGMVEQDPEQWWEATAACLREATTALGARRADLRALAVTATSGTLCLLDAAGHPVRPAIMYSDRRATDEAVRLNDAGRSLTERLGYRFDRSFALPKLLWVQRHEPETFARARYFAHAADVLTGHLTGDYGISDWSHALKSGYDLLEARWPDFIGSALGLPGGHFPRIVPPGAVIGQVTTGASAATGLPAGCNVVAGMTDGCTAQIAGGAIEPGQWLSVLGTTLVVKGVTTALLRDPAGRVYCHRHPAGMWLPGGASNTGGEVLARRFGDADLATLDQRAAALTPGDLVCYPLERTGERFPFVSTTARGFVIDSNTGAALTPEQVRNLLPEQLYTACLEGVGYLERLAYATLAGLGAQVEGPIRTAGGGARSRVWLQIRANILNRPLVVPQHSEAAFGAAILAASAALHPDVSAATRAMVRLRDTIEPQAPIVAHYAERYEQFVMACRERGYL